MSTLNTPFTLVNGVVTYSSLLNALAVPGAKSTPTPSFNLTPNATSLNTNGLSGAYIPVLAGGAQAYINPSILNTLYLTVTGTTSALDVSLYGTTVPASTPFTPTSSLPTSPSVNTLLFPPVTSSATSTTVVSNALSAYSTALTPVATSASSPTYLWLNVSGTSASGTATLSMNYSEVVTTN